MGQAGVVPLRRRALRRFQYPLPANDTADTLPMAAEPSTPYGDAAAGPAAEQVTQGSA
jgi:hypothetical protein